MLYIAKGFLPPGCLALSSRDAGCKTVVRPGASPPRFSTNASAADRHHRRADVGHFGRSGSTAKRRSRASAVVPQPAATRYGNLVLFARGLPSDRLPHQGRSLRSAGRRQMARGPTRQDPAAHRQSNRPGDRLLDPRARDHVLCPRHRVLNLTGASRRLSGEQTGLPMPQAGAAAPGAASLAWRPIKAIHRLVIPAKASRKRDKTRYLRCRKTPSRSRPA